jgi:2-C-methyl-D-erythritol 4-phosphate cytidylyltransferase
VNKETPKAAVIITAAGTSQRMGIGVKKEFLTLNKKSVLFLSLQPFIDSNLFSKYIIVLPQNDLETGRKILAPLAESREFIYISGGSTRQESVFNGLLSLEKKNPDIVLIHDGARPWITETVIKDVYSLTLLKEAVIPIVPSINAMKSINSSGTIVENLNREFTVAAQTPQGFNYKNILKAHKSAKLDNTLYIDDAEIYNRYIGNVSTVSGDIDNIKITYMTDVDLEDN